MMQGQLPCLLHLFLLGVFHPDLLERRTEPASEHRLDATGRGTMVHMMQGQLPRLLNLFPLGMVYSPAFQAVALVICQQ